MRIQERDKALLQMLHRYGLLESRHIHAKCFRGISSTTMYRRLRKLEDEELICRSVGLKNGIAAYYLGKAGAAAIGLELYTRYTNRNAFEHELAITDLRMALEKLSLCQEFISERQVRKNFQWSRSSRHSEQVIPDGILIEDIEGKPAAIALEMELNPKSLKRYKRVFEDYRFMRTTAFVWYVVADSSIKESIFKTWQNMQRFDFSPRLIVSSFNETISNPKNAMLHFDDGATSTVGKFFSIDKGKEDLLTTSEDVAQCVSTFDEKNAALP